MPTERINSERITDIYQRRSSNRSLERTKAHINNNTLRLITAIDEDMRTRLGELLKEGDDAGRSIAATASKLLSVGLDKGVFRSARKRCLTHASVPIYTLDGWKPIGKIKVGDLVLTHQGRFRKVNKVIQTPNQFPETYKISFRRGSRSGKSNFTELTLTAGHPILLNGEWKAVDDAKVGDKIRFLASKCEDCGHLIFHFNKLCGVCAGKRGAVGNWEKNEDKILQTLHKNAIVYAPERLKAVSLHMSEMVNRGTHPFLQKNIIEKNAEYWKKRAVDGTHPFQQPDVIKKSRSSLGKNGKGRSWPEKKLGLALIEKGIETEAQYHIFRGADHYGIGRYYFLDFALPDLKIAIECDGEYWHQDKEKDLERQKYIESLGWQFIRFTGKEISKNLSGCVEKIKRLCMNHNHEYEFLDVAIEKIECRQIVPSNRKFSHGIRLYNLEVEEDESYIAKGFVIHNCWLIAKTELHRARQSAAIDIYRDAGIKLVRFTGIPDDGRICSTCRSHHGEVVQLSEITIEIPVHPSCRCRWLPAAIDLHIEPPRSTPKGKLIETKIKASPSKLRYIVNLENNPRTRKRATGKKFNPERVKKALDCGEKPLNCVDKSLNVPIESFNGPESYENDYVVSKGYDLALDAYRLARDKISVFDNLVEPFTKDAVFKSRVQGIDSMLSKVVKKRETMPKFGVLSLDDHVMGDLVLPDNRRLPNVVRGLTKAGFKFGIYLGKTNSGGENGVFGAVNLGDGIGGSLRINTTETIEKSWSNVPDSVRFEIDQARLVSDKFLVGLIKSRRKLTDVRKSRVQGKMIPQKIDGKLVWTKALGDDLVREVKGGENAKVGDVILIKGMPGGRVTAIGKDGVTARFHGTKYQIMHADVRLLKTVG